MTRAERRIEAAKKREARARAMLSRAMIRASLAATLLATAAAAEPPAFVMRSGDTYALTRQSADVAILEYHNHAASLSPGGDVALHHDGLEVETWTDINAGADAAERLRVTPPEGWTAFPPEIDVPDGETGRVVLRRGDWNGM
jgi:hypothetical protein